MPVFDELQNTFTSLSGYIDDATDLVTQAATASNQLQAAFATKGPQMVPAATPPSADQSATFVAGDGGGVFDRIAASTGLPANIVKYGVIGLVVVVVVAVAVKLLRGR